MQAQSSSVWPSQSLSCPSQSSSVGTQPLEVVGPDAPIPVSVMASSPEQADDASAKRERATTEARTSERMAAPQESRAQRYPYPSAPRGQSSRPRGARSPI